MDGCTRKGNKKMKATVTFRHMMLDDLDQILEIEHTSFTVPWSREAFHNELVNNMFANYLVAETSEGRVIGYCGAWLIIDEAHITNIALLPNYRGKKIGEGLLKSMMQLAKLKNCYSMTLEVRVSNKVAQNLYRKLGFQDGGIRKQYYSDNGEDALVMWVTL